MLKRRPVEQHVQYPLFSSDIKERNPDQESDYALAGQKKHHESGEAQDASEEVSDDLDEKGNDGVAFVPVLHNRTMKEKIIGRGPGDKKGDEQQADQKCCQRKESQSFKQGYIGYLKGRKGQCDHGFGCSTCWSPTNT